MVKGIQERREKDFLRFGRKGEKAMTKSELFKRAHIIARMTVKAAGSYQIAFSCALKAVYAGEYSNFGKMINDMRSILTAAGANWHLCRDLRTHVIYFN